jgi:hypothetical protein
MFKAIILGCCSTGAKFTPLNHCNTGDVLFDRISAGVDIAVTQDEIAHEVDQLTDLGVRYYHYHARNPGTREQTTDNAVYRDIGKLVRSLSPEMLISYGASRNGPEVLRNIAAHGEWERVSHTDLSLAEGGAHFVTMQAAIELQMICDLERRTRPLTRDFIESDDFAAAVADYVPSAHLEDVRMEVNSTTNGSNYGRSSPAIQLEVYGRAIAARRRQNLFDEVEWVQTLRSYAQTRMAILHPDLALGAGGQLNITLLFGFSPKLPFPKSYAEFRSVVAMAKSLEHDSPGGPVKRHVSISIGGAVLPQHAAREIRPLDVGRNAGVPADALHRLIAYSAQPDSEVDILRVGMEDSPFLLDENGGLRPTNNIELCRVAADGLMRNGATLLTDPSHIIERGAAPLRIAA